MQVLALMSLAAIITTVALRRTTAGERIVRGNGSAHDTLLLRRSWFQLDIILYALLGAAYNAVFGFWLWQLARARRARRAWTKRRQHYVGEALLKALALNCMWVAGMVLSASVLADPAQACGGTVWQSTALFVLWQVRFPSQCLSARACSLLHRCAMYQPLLCVAPLCVDTGARRRALTAGQAIAPHIYDSVHV